MPRASEVPPKSGEKTSELLRRILTELPADDTPIDHLVIQLRRRSFGGIIMLLALLGLLPGISLLAGLAILIPGVQMLFGLPAPLLPKFIRQRQIGRSKLRAAGATAIPWIERMERYVKPRWLNFLVLPLPQVVGLTVLALGFLIAIPVPFINFVPAIALLCLSLGLLERDGLMIFLGLVIAVLAIAIGISIAQVTLDAALLYFGKGA